MNEQQKKERIEELKAIIGNPEVDMQERKKAQKELIEMLATPEPWVKQPIITLVDEQLSKIAELDLGRIAGIKIRTMEHPEGFQLSMDVHPCLRIREGMIVRDSGNNPEGFFWLESFYQKMKTKAKANYFVGGDTGEYLENFYRLRAQIKSPSDGKQLSFKIARSRTPLEVFELPGEERTAVLVTEEIAQILGGRLIASYNMDAPEDYDPVEPGDILVVDTADETYGLYYRVDMKQVSETYRPGTL
jgi:hypothetical protein